VTTTNDNAPPYVAGQPCDRCRGAHGEGDAETGERLPCARCFGLSPRPAPPLDLDAIDARERAALAAVRERLRCERLDPAGFVALQREERRADDAVALVARVRELEAEARRLRSEHADDHKALVGFRRVMLDVCEALDGVQPEPDYDAPAELGAWDCEEIARRIAAARREGAEAMREAVAAGVLAAWRDGESIGDAVRRMPLPGGEP
jgi:hypothetical protein